MNIICNMFQNDFKRWQKTYSFNDFAPVFTMNYDTNSKEKIVLEISKLCISMWELLQLFETIPYVSSWLIHVWYFTVSHLHHLYKMPCYLKELYLDNCSFEGLGFNDRLEIDQTWTNKVIAMKLFIKQLMHVDFRKSFKLYFENLDIYFLAWNVIFRNNWKEEKPGTVLNKILKHISRIFCLKRYKFRFFSHSINLFSFKEIERCIEIQKKTWLLLKSKKLVILSWWVTIPMFYMWIFQKFYFKKLVFRNWIVRIPDYFQNAWKKASALKKVDFIECWFIWSPIVNFAGRNFNVQIFPNARSEYPYVRNLWLNDFYENILKGKIITRTVAETYIENFIRRAGLKKLLVRMIDWDFYEKRVNEYLDLVNSSYQIQNRCAELVYEFK
jgi:hypothetical protein